jgi:hypothetical protein
VTGAGRERVVFDGSNEDSVAKRVTSRRAHLQNAQIFFPATTMRERRDGAAMRSKRTKRKRATYDTTRSVQIIGCPDAIRYISRHKKKAVSTRVDEGVVARDGGDESGGEISHPSRAVRRDRSAFALSIRVR